MRSKGWNVEGSECLFRTPSQPDAEGRELLRWLQSTVFEKAPEVTKPRADGGHRGPKLSSKLGEFGLGGLLEIAERPKETKGFTVLYSRRVVERTFAWMSRCRRLAKDFVRSLQSSQALVQFAACRFLMRRVERASDTETKRKNRESDL